MADELPKTLGEMLAIPIYARAIALLAGKKPVWDIPRILAHEQYSDEDEAERVTQLVAAVVANKMRRSAWFFISCAVLVSFLAFCLEYIAFFIAAFFNVP